MAESNFLEFLPPNEIARYNQGSPKNGVAFTGYPRPHPQVKDRIILVYDPLGINPMVMEFRLEDVLFAEELHSAVTESGEGVPLIKLWVRRGARGVMLEPFEVDEPIRFIHKTREFRDKFLNNE